MLERKVVSQCISSDYCRGWNDAVDAMPRWISVEERLPECDKIVLGYTNRYGGQCEMVYYSNRIMAWCANGCILIPKVTHWMHLPEPPEEE